MTESKLTVTELESIYDTLAQSIDRVEAQKHLLFLTKLALLLADRISDGKVIQKAIEEAQTDL